METVDIEGLCDNVAKAVERVRIGFRSKLDTSELLERFWCLQDHVTRLLESASDSRQQTFDILKRMHPRLIRDILDVLHFTEKTQFKNASAICAAGHNINRSLAKLEFLREQENVMVASA